MSFLIHITDSLNGHFSKSRDIVAHNGALRSKFAFFTSSTIPSPPSPLFFAFSSSTWLQYSSWVLDVVENDLAHSRIWQERVRKRANGSSFPFSFLPSSPSTKFVLCRPRRSRHLPHIRTGSGKHDESLRRNSQHVREIYSRGGKLRMSSCSSPSEFPDSLSSSEFCRDMQPRRRLVRRLLLLGLCTFPSNFAWNLLSSFFLFFSPMDQWIFKRSGLSKYHVFLEAPQAVNSLQKDDQRIHR